LYPGGIKRGDIPEKNRMVQGNSGVCDIVPDSSEIKSGQDLRRNRLGDNTRQFVLQRPRVIEKRAIY
jgi:hypothetical protein